ncbi:HK97 family phage prohead protease [Mesorhizobium sp. M1E.F.Ca.ET.063.01.1.1]|uniref:HK97 family phage prohead protease n=1 Tax=Mesorhizobium sp. M1E.F.Ca.ET.063.01.1.1 TaxID=2496750 RepID=UPI000FCBC92E|nr:HK97 family phage prohead protease [Mesorhizobium sp. M1E.F.Ca.ET.063.01.1.1]RUW76899.1 HK97 family phage prohead protease [Mesorhizobium sp. M1E.F.Ca.ET.063.01.1.1]
MLYGAPVSLEIRAEGGATRLTGRFPYGSETTLGDGRRERFAARAFRSRIDAGENVFLLAGHDPEKPLASTEAGSLTLRDGEDALHIEARVAATTTWANDALAALAAGLTKGISPGFRVRSGGDVVTRSADGLLRTVNAADLFEVSLVTLPAYDQAQIAARSWALAAAEADDAGMRRAFNRWRA